MKKPSIEQWAKKFLEVYHPTHTLNFVRQVKKVDHFNWFTLSIFSNNNIIFESYLVMPLSTRLEEKSFPYYKALAPYLIEAIEDDSKSFWIGYVLLDIDGQAIDAQRFQVYKSH